MQDGNTHVKVSRRRMLALLASGAGLVGCGGVGGLLWLANRGRGQDTYEEVIVTATPNPTPDAFPVVAREAWGALPANHTAPNENGFYSEDNPEGWRVYPDPLADQYQTVVIHHSVIDEGDDIATLQAIQDLHRNDRGWADVAYHYFVGQTGTVYAGRDVRARGAHVAGFNTGSVGVCLLGDFTQREPAGPQLVAAGDLVAWLARTLALTHIAGHADFNDWTVCPGPNLAKHVQTFATHAGLQVGTDGYIPPAT